MSDFKIIRLQKFLTMHWILISFSIMFAWITFYFPESSTLVQRCCFTENDPSWVPEGYIQEPIIGVHYFGDFQLYRAWSLQHNPYDVGYNATYLPIFHFVWKVINYFPLQFSFLMYLLLTFLSLFLAIFHISKKYNLSVLNILNITFTFGILSLPFIVDIDRGNFQTIVVSLASLYMINILNEKKSIFNFLLILICASIKPYYLLFILFQGKSLLKLKYISFLLGFVLLNILSMQIITSKLYFGFKSLFLALSFYGSLDSIPYIQHAISFTGSFFKITEIIWQTESATNFLINNFRNFQIISILISLIGIFIFSQTYLPIWVRFLSGISIITTGQIGSANYSLLWLTFLLILVVFEESKINFELKVLNLLQNKYIYILIVLGLIPFWLVPQNRNAFYQTIPISIIITLLNFYALYLIARHFKIKQLEKRK